MLSCAYWENKLKKLISVKNDNFAFDDFSNFAFVIPQKFMTEQLLNIFALAPTCSSIGIHSNQLWITQ